MRRVAAEARRVLLEMASARLGVPVDQLAVSDARDHRESRSLEARHLRRTDRRQEVQRHADRRPTSTPSPAWPKPRPVQELKYTGQSPQRDDIPAKVDGSLKWAVDVKLPGMVHARNVKPPFACAKLIGIDESSVQEPAGLHQSGEQGQLCRGRLRTRRAGHQRRPAAQDHMGEAGHRAVPRVGRSVQVHARRQPPHARGRRCRTRNPSSPVVGNPDAAFAGAAKVDRSRVRNPVPGTHRLRGRARHGRSVERPDDDLFERHEVVRHAARRRHVSRHAARQSARGLDAGSAGLRPHRRRGCRLARRPGSRAKSAGRFACSGCERKRPPGIPRARRSWSKCAERWMPQGVWSRTITTPVRATTITSATTSPIPC